VNDEKYIGLDVASDRPMVDTVQPQGLLRFRNRSASSPLIEDAAAEMEQTQNRGTTPTKRLPQ
jgi:hypothetical protein